VAHPWPGNIRELQNAVERALIVAEGSLLTAAHLGLVAPAAAPKAGAADRPADLTAAGSLTEVEKHTILAALDRAKGNKTQAAAALGITRTKLYTRLRQLGLLR
jgi:two-component system response regulator HydG